MARTRASKGNDTAANTNTSSAKPSVSKSRFTLSSTSQNPPKIFILPNKATSEARIVLLLHPRYANPARYLVCPETGFYEFTRIAAPKSTPRSWLIHTDSQCPDKPDTNNTTFNTLVTNGAELFVATPIDPLFLILPTLIDPSSKSEKRRYVSSDDHFDRIQETSPHLWEILRWGGGRVRSLLETRLGAVCDTVETGDEHVFRVNEDKLMTEILNKARRMSTQPLPHSMEEKFVTKPLEAPVLGVKREATFVTTTTTTVTTSTQDATAPTTDSSSAPELTNETSNSKTEPSDGQTSVSSTDGGISSTADTPTAITSITVTQDESKEVAELLLPAMVASPDIVILQRLRTAFNFVCSSYVPPSLVAMLRAKISTWPDVDFEPLDTYLSEVNRLKQEATAARSAGDYGRKRLVDEEDAIDRAEKKRKKDDEEKRKKAGESRGVRNLKKVNTTGMKKMSDFFTKKA